ncbi:MAG: glycerophosphoryl diester phosphodiesterase membrane domain-containing protein [Armatimonadota bacterium]
MASGSKSRPRQIQQLGTFGILKRTIGLYKSNFGLLFGIYAVLGVPCQIIYFFSSPGTCSFQESYFSAAVSFLTSVAFQPAIAAALVYGLSDVYLGRQVTVVDCYRRALRGSILLPLTGVLAIEFAVSYLLLMPGPFATAFRSSFFVLYMLIAIPCVFYLSLRFFLIAPVCILERTDVKATLSRSWSLMKGSMWKSFWIFALLIYLFLAINLIAVPLLLNAMHGSLTQHIPIAKRILGSAVSLLWVPLITIAQMCVYFDIRARRESFDTAQLVTLLDRATVTASENQP